MINGEQIRSFIAIEVPSEVKSEIDETQKELKSSRYDFVKWVAVEGIHITLKFLGNVPVAKLDPISKAMHEVVTGILPFTIETGGLGAFPNFNRPRVIWLGFEGEVDKLIALQQNIDSSLIKLGFPVEKRPFSPHVTIARIREGAPAQSIRAFGELMKVKSFGSKFKIRVENVRLMRSQLFSSGAVYTCLAEINFILVQNA